MMMLAEQKYVSQVAKLLCDQPGGCKINYIIKPCPNAYPSNCTKRRQVKIIENLLDQNVHNTPSSILTTFNRDRRKVRLQKPMQLEK